MADERDPKVSQRYRDLGSEEPPRELDQSILAAARRAGDRQHAPLVTPAGRHRWYYALGAAAVLVLAVAVTVHVERERPDPESVVTAPLPEAPKEQEPSDTVARADKAQPAPKRITPPKDAPPPVFAPDPPRAAKEESRTEQVQSAPAAPRERVAGLARIESPERWLERIAELRLQGKHQEADEGLKQFRARYPDYKISDDMLGKVEKK